MTSSGALRLAWLCALIAWSPACDGGPQSVAPPVERRIATLAPAAAEMLVALGLERQTVAIGSRGPWPASMAELPQVGRFDRPNLERIVQLEITDVVTTRSAAAAASMARLRDRDIGVLELDTETFDGVFDSIRRLGARFERAGSATALIARMRGELQQVRDCTAAHPRRSAVFVVGHDPLFVAGPGSHLDALLRVAGADNLFGDEGAAYRQVSMEAVLERSPEVLLEFQTEGAESPAKRWAQWEFLPAVGAGRIYGIPPEAIAVPGVRLPEMAALLASRMHPVRLTRATDGAWRCEPR